MAMSVVHSRLRHYSPLGGMGYLLSWENSHQGRSIDKSNLHRALAINYSLVVQEFSAGGLERHDSTVPKTFIPHGTLPLLASLDRYSLFLRRSGNHSHGRPSCEITLPRSL